ncbi:hypothetical protein [Methanobacterium sp.]|uniref:hypothetical protein n=1 Tax=Methanobacterium sp. TaxID=2164 RepID=UPI0025E7EE8E|nr:hypothetical protein [Methanobacterium sp.]
MRSKKYEPCTQSATNYLTDWKNILTHSIVGVAILLIALFAPVSPYIRIAFVGVVVAFNVLRMRYT